MATTTNRVVGIQGLAGTGKSRMLKTAKAMIEGEGYAVRALAPYGSQVKALRELNVPANTLASFLKAREKDIGAKTVLVVDEAGVVPTRLMEETLRIAEKAGARVVLLGDTAQTKAVEAGRPFDQLQTAGMTRARMTDIRRQQDPELRYAVELAAIARENEKTAALDLAREKGGVPRDSEAVWARERNGSDGHYGKRETGDRLDAGAVAARTFERTAQTNALTRQRSEGNEREAER